MAKDKITLRYVGDGLRIAALPLKLNCIGVQHVETSMGRLHYEVLRVSPLLPLFDLALSPLCRYLPFITRWRSNLVKVDVKMNCECNP